MFNVGALDVGRSRWMENIIYEKFRETVNWDEIFYLCILIKLNKLISFTKKLYLFVLCKVIFRFVVLIHSFPNDDIIHNL